MQVPDILVFPGKMLAFRCSKHKKTTNLVACKSCKYIEVDHHTMEIEEQRLRGGLVPEIRHVCLVTVFHNLPTKRAWLLKDGS